MKRLVCMLVLVVMMVSLFTACGSFTCDMCGKESSGKKYEEEILGQEVVYCEDCHDGLNDLGNLFG